MRFTALFIFAALVLVHLKVRSGDERKLAVSIARDPQAVAVVAPVRDVAAEPLVLVPVVQAAASARESLVLSAPQPLFVASVGEEEPFVFAVTASSEEMLGALSDEAFQFDTMMQRLPPAEQPSPAEEQPNFGITLVQAFQDLDGDGLRGLEEPGVGGLTVTLSRVVDDVAQPFLRRDTDAGGALFFPALAAGVWQLELDPEQLQQRHLDAATRTLRFRADGSSGGTLLFALGEQLLVQNRRVVQGSIWLDFNANNVLDEAALQPEQRDAVAAQPLTVHLLRDGRSAHQASAEWTADFGAVFAFENLPPGNYEILVIPSLALLESFCPHEQAPVMEVPAEFDLIERHIPMHPTGSPVVRDVFTFYDLRNSGEPDGNTAINNLELRLEVFRRGILLGQRRLLSGSQAAPGHLALDQIVDLPDLRYVLSAASAIDRTQATTPLRYALPPPNQRSRLFFGFEPVVTDVDLVGFDVAAQPGGIALRWRTSAERNNLGFRLHRSPHIDIPPVAISDLILGQGTGVGASYRHFDAAATGESWFYWLEDIEYDLSSEWHGPFPYQP